MKRLKHILGMAVFALVCVLVLPIWIAVINFYDIEE